MYKNPIILCDYSDPDVIRAGGLYYLVASSFNFTPGLPVLASANLVDWKLVNYALENIPVSRYMYPQNAQGVWAPSFSRHNGTYYIVFAMPDEGIYTVETDDISGNWGRVRQVHISKGIIDPFLFWDDDGKAYIIHAYAKSRCGFNSKIGILRFDEKSFRTSGGDTVIFDGTETQPTIEGPKMYKRNGYYYIFAPAGGVSHGWQTVLRSQNIFGPYEEKIVLAEGNSGVNGPHQGALVDTPSGEEWFVHFQDRGIYGRVTHLQPVKWKDGWPLVGTAVETGEIPGEPYLKYKKPKCAKKAKIQKEKSTALRAFAGADLNWQWSGNHSGEFGKIYGVPDSSVESFKLNVLNVSSYEYNGFPVLWNCSNILTQKIRKANFCFKTDIVLSNLPEKCRAGVIFLGEEYASVAIEKTAAGFDLVYLKSENTEKTDIVRTEKEEARIKLKAGGENPTVRIRMDFFQSSDCSGAVQFKLYEGGFIRKLKWISGVWTTENAHWVGGRFGVYAVGKSKGSVQFYNVRVRY